MQTHLQRVVVVRGRAVIRADPQQARVQVPSGPAADGEVVSFYSLLGLDV